MPPLGTVCGFEVLVGGPVTQIVPPSVARQCVASPTSRDPTVEVTLTASNGKRYVVQSTSRGSVLLWSARLPAGSYHALGWGCVGPGRVFTLNAGETLRSVRVDRGCVSDDLTVAP